MNKLTCRESFKIPGRYHANIIPCISIIMQGLEMGPLIAESFGGYRCLRLASAACAAFVPEFAGRLGSLSA